MLLEKIQNQEKEIESNNTRLLNVKREFQDKIETLKKKFSNKDTKEFCDIFFRAPSAEKYSFEESQINIIKYKIIKQDIKTNKGDSKIDKNVVLFSINVTINQFKERFDEINNILVNLKDIMEE